jgi:hypothetical protein
MRIPLIKGQIIDTKIVYYKNGFPSTSRTQIARVSVDGKEVEINSTQYPCKATSSLVESIVNTAKASGLKINKLNGLKLGFKFL